MDYLSLLRSELKVKVLLSLLKSAKKLADFRADIPDTRDTTILHVLEEFENLELIIKSQNTYQLTPLGLIKTEMIKHYTDSIEVIDNFKEFWLVHNVSSIPTKLLLNLNALKGAELVQSSASELGVIHQKFLDLVQESKKLQGAAPIFHPDFVMLVGFLLSQGNEVELILTKPVIEKIFSLVDISDLNRYVESGRLTIYTKDNLEIALAVTENSFSLGLFLTSGKYDDGMDLLAFNDEAIDWGSDLFREMLKTSHKIDLKTYVKT